MDSLQEIMQEIDHFNKERDWDQFHTPENIAKSIAIEAGELLECFQWSTTDYDPQALKEELADVMNYCFQMAIALNLDVKQIIFDKMQKNAAKYPVEKAKGSAVKYDRL